MTCNTRIPEAAAYFEVTPRTIYNWIHAGYITAERVGPRRGRVRVDLESVRRETIGGAAA